MNLELLFTIASVTALFGWLLLLTYPFSARWAYLVSGRILPLLLAAFYTTLLVKYWGASEGGFGSLAEVVRLFSLSEAVLVGWVHYLAFDLFIGAWECETARKEGIPFYLVVPCLVLTLMAGPFGLCAFFLTRALHRKFANPLSSDE